MVSDRAQATGLIQRMCDGEAAASDELLPLVYDHLRSLAGSMLGQERPDHTLQPTALVHEAFLRLVDADAIKDDDGELAKQHFVGLAVLVMRRILVDHARSRGRQKRGGGARRVTLDDALLSDGSGEWDLESILDLEAALERMQEIDPQLVKAAELRLFGGLSVAEMGHCMGLSLTRAKVLWASVRAMLSRFLIAES